MKAGMKYTEIGWIPKDWEVTTLGSCGDVIVGLTYSPADVATYGVLVLRSSNIKNNKLDFSDCVFVKMNLPDRVRVHENDLLICVRNGSKKLIGKCALISKMAVDEAFGAFMSVFRAPNNKFLFQVFQSSIIQQQIQNNLGATINQITNKDLKSYWVALPNSQEQQAIAEALSDADAWIESLEALIEKKRLIKQGAMQELLRPKEGWELRRLNDVGHIVTGGTPSTLIEEFWDGDVPWITPTDISDKRNIYSGNRSITEKGLKCIRPLPENCLLVTCIASIGKNAILKARGACNQQINAIIPKPEFDVTFLYYLMELNTQVLLRKAGTTATLILSKVTFGSIELKFPPIDKQRELASILSDMDAEIETLEQKLSKARQIKQGMMQQLLTGQIRLVKSANAKAVETSKRMTA